MSIGKEYISTRLISSPSRLFQNWTTGHAQLWFYSRYWEPVCDGIAGSTYCLPCVSGTYGNLSGVCSGAGSMYCVHSWTVEVGSGAMSLTVAWKCIKLCFELGTRFMLALQGTHTHTCKLALLNITTNAGIQCQTYTHTYLLHQKAACLYWTQTHFTYWLLCCWFGELPCCRCCQLFSMCTMHPWNLQQYKWWEFWTEYLGCASTSMVKQWVILGLLVPPFSSKGIG